MKRDRSTIQPERALKYVAQQAVNQLGQPVLVVFCVLIDGRESCLIGIVLLLFRPNYLRPAKLVGCNRPLGHFSSCWIGPRTHQTGYVYILMKLSTLPRKASTYRAYEG